MELRNTETSVFSSCFDLEQFRLKIYDENPGSQYIPITRKKYLDKVIGIFKNSGLNFYKKPLVEFLTEPGIA